MRWETRITELLDCEYPIIQGALSRIGNWKFAAAVSNAGAHGCLTAAVSLTPDKLRDDIRRCRDATGKPFSVNITVGMCPYIDEMLEVCLEEGVEVIETAVFNADVIGKRVKDAGRKWVHKTATIKHALHAEQQGADALILVGLEGIGFKNAAQLPTMTTIAWAARQLKVPVIAAGGIGDARTFLGALGLGAEGVMMGTAFMATQECPISERFKQRMVETDPDNPYLRNTVLAPPNPKDFEAVMSKRDEMPLEKWLTALERVMLKHDDWMLAPEMWNEDYDRISSLMSFAVTYIDQIPTVKEFVDGIIGGARDILAGWKFLNQ
ncbi:MAG: nitronate monooxygenase [Dehalococcoidia bacterium]|jgi:nitronate monooxygenase|nr:nitronate monooxygenase [Dehalococcoidia bacterium]